MTHYFDYQVTTGTSSGHYMYTEASAPQKKVYATTYKILMSKYIFKKKG